MMKLLLLLLAVVGHASAQVISSGVSCTDVRLIVDKHNDLRMSLANGSLVGQPKASNMERMVWDDALYTLAQNYANKMLLQHNSNRSDPRFYVGENLFASSTTGSTTVYNWDGAIQAWFNEYKQYKYLPIGQGVGGTGHYTQVIWYDSVRIGCGGINYLKDGWRNFLYVCNYGPGGNYVGSYPYSNGTSKACDKLCCTKSQCDGLWYGKVCSKVKPMYWTS